MSQSDLASLVVTRRISDIVEVTLAERDQLARLAAEISASPAAAPELFCRQAQRAASKMPRRLVDLIAAFKRRGSTSGAILFKGLPEEDRPVTTPRDNRQHLGEHTRLARVQAIVNCAYGEMIAYEVEGFGRFYQDVVPNRELADSQTSQSSKAELELHTEQAFSPLRPDALSLACLNGDRKAFTHVLPAHVIVKNLLPAERSLLGQPLWKTTVDHSCRLPGHEFIAGLERGPLSIMSGSEDDPKILFDQDLMRGLTQEARRILRRIVGIYEDHHFSYSLAPGQLLLIDNQRALHGRSAFTPKYDGTDRFVVRTFVVEDFARSSHARPGNGHVVCARFS